MHKNAIARLGSIVTASVQANVRLDARVNAFMLGQVGLREEKLVAVGKTAGKGSRGLMAGNVHIKLRFVGKGLLAVLPRAGVRQVDEVIVADGVEAASGARVAPFDGTPKLTMLVIVESVLC